MELVRGVGFSIYCGRPIQRAVFTSFILFAIFYLSAPSNESKRFLLNTLRDAEKVESQLKTILIWNPFSRFELKVLGKGQEPFTQHGCPINACSITTNRSLAPMHTFDAIIFNMPPLAIASFPRDEHRRPDQRYIFFSQEPPSYIGEEVDKFNNLFNWTMSYAAHSDIRYHYGEVVPLSTAPQNEVALSSYRRAARQAENYAQGKTGLVAWFVSHCYTQSRREKYVALLRQYIPVDIYGGCYTLRCSMNQSSFLSTNECYDMLDSTYKFYLAFENSFCHDYVTEKFFDALQRRIIPVVMGAANYSAIAPPHSFIDAAQYSPRELANYLKLLDANDELYNEYFWWKSHYRIVNRYPELASTALCTLCEKLHHDRTPSVYSDIAAGWSHKTQCSSPRLKGVRFFWGIF